MYYQNIPKDETIVNNCLHWIRNSSRRCLFRPCGPSRTLRRLADVNGKWTVGANAKAGEEAATWGDNREQIGLGGVFGSAQPGARRGLSVQQHPTGLQAA